MKKLIVLLFPLLLLAGCGTKVTIDDAILYEDPIAPELQEHICFENPDIDIYMYHYVREPERDDPSGVVHQNSITPEEAEAHYKYMSEQQKLGKVDVMFMSELQDQYESNCFSNNYIAVITFDDGRWDNYEYLLPLAEKYQIKAHLGLIEKKLAKDFDSRIDPFMVVPEVNQMIDSGRFEVVGHSYSHVDLTQMSKEYQHHEICRSTRNLETLLDIEINTFVYPMGKFNDISKEVVEECGLRFALSTLTGSNDISMLTGHQSFQLNRHRVSTK